MVFPWVDLVGPTVANTLARECSVETTPSLIRLLNLFGEHLDAVVNTRCVADKKNGTDHKALSDLVEIMRSEVQEFRDARHEQELQIELLNVVQQAEMHTPVVHCKLKGLPLLIVEVTRSYAARRVFVSPSWRTSGTCKGKQVGRVRNAVNHVTAACKECRHQLSISGVLNIWFARALKSPRSKKSTGMATRKRSTKVSQLASKCEDSRLDTIATQGQARDVVSGYASDESFEIASTPSEKINSRKRPLPSYSNDGNCNHSHQSRKKWFGEPCATVSSLSVPRNSRERWPDHFMEQSARSLHPERVQHLEPVTNAELRASVNAALNTRDAQFESIQPRVHERQVSSGHAPPPPSDDLRSGAAVASGSKVSSTVVATSVPDKDAEHGSVVTGSRDGSVSTCAVESNGGPQEFCNHENISIGNKLVTTDGKPSHQPNVKPHLPSSFVNDVHEVDGREHWTITRKVVDPATRYGWQVTDILKASSAPRVEEAKGINALSDTHDLEDYIRELD